MESHLNHRVSKISEKPWKPPENTESTGQNNQTTPMKKNNGRKSPNYSTHPVASKRGAKPNPMNCMPLSEPRDAEPDINRTGSLG